MVGQNLYPVKSYSDIHVKLLYLQESVPRKLHVSWLLVPSAKQSLTTFKNSFIIYC